MDTRSQDADGLDSDALSAAITRLGAGQAFSDARRDEVRALRASEVN